MTIKRLVFIWALFFVHFTIVNLAPMGLVPLSFALLCIVAVWGPEWYAGLPARKAESKAVKAFRKELNDA